MALIFVLFELPFWGSFGSTVSRDNVHCNARRRCCIRTGSNPISTIALKKSRQKFDCFANFCLHVFVTSFKRQNDVTPSTVMTDVIFSVTMTL